MSDQYNKCNKENIIRQCVKVEAQITVTPLVEHGDPKVYCINSSIHPTSDCCNRKRCACNSYDYDFCDCNSYDYDFCDCNSCNWDTDYDEACESERARHKCNFTLTQVICIEIPISIDAKVNIKEGIACCDRPDVKSVDNINKISHFTCP